jgi:hypothetical protein
VIEAFAVQVRRRWLGHVGHDWCDDRALLGGTAALRGRAHRLPDRTKVGYLKPNRFIIILTLVEAVAD